MVVAASNQYNRARLLFISTKVQGQEKLKKVESLYGNPKTARLHILQPSAVSAAQSSRVFTNLSHCLAIVLKCRLAPKSQHINGSSLHQAEWMPPLRLL